MSRLLVAATATGVLLTAAPASRAHDIDLTGAWRRSYQSQGGNRGESVLVLNQAGDDLTGTIQVTGVSRSFGDTAQPIAKGRIKGREVGFEAVGADGGVFRADFKVSRDGREINGWGRHRGPGYDAPVQFGYTRQP